MSGFGAIGPAIEAAHDARMYEKKRKDNKDIVNEDRKWNKMMADTAHQREVSDLRKAGLNPILSAGGGGAPAPTSDGGQAPNTADIHMPDLFAYGIDLKRLEQQDKLIKLQEASTASNITKNLSSEELNKAKKILAGKGMLKAQLEGEASTVMSNMIKWLKDAYTGKIKPKHLTTPDSSGGEIQQQQTIDSNNGL